MIKFTGKGNLQFIELNVFGDGVSKTLSVDLTEAPFDLSFGQGVNLNYPTDHILVNMSPGLPKTVTVSGSILTITFNDPPPATEIPPVVTALPENSLNFKVYFLYGPSATVEAKNRAHRKNS